jgi:hypothetical protein
VTFLYSRQAKSGKIFVFAYGSVSIMAIARMLSESAIVVFNEGWHERIGGAMLEIRCNLSSFTSRSWRVWCARSTRPLAAGVFAHIPSMLSS